MRGRQNAQRGLKMSLRCLKMSRAGFEDGTRGHEPRNSGVPEAGTGTGTDSLLGGAWFC